MTGSKLIGVLHKALCALAAVSLLLAAALVGSPLAWGEASTASQKSPITIGSKNFGENYLLAEIAAQLLERRGFTVDRRFGLGGTMICYEALKNGEIDFYIEYTGTLTQAILAMSGRPGQAEINSRLAEDGIKMLGEIGFNNTYAIAVRAAQARALGLARISDLQAYPELRAVFSHEFLERDDGWPGLAQRYDLPQTVVGIEHALAYAALARDRIDMTDAYSTDGELARYDLAVLEDDKGFFPPYKAVPIAVQALPSAVEQVILALQGRIDDVAMQGLNARVAVDGLSYQTVASEYLNTNAQAFEIMSDSQTDDSLFAEIGGHLLRHIQLTVIAVLASIIVGLGVSLAVYSRPRTADAFLYICGLLQTVPSLALLALMIPVFGIGVVPAIIALFLYSLLPIVRNAITALRSVDPTLVRVGRAIGLSPREQLRLLRLPLSMPAILAGIRTAAVISIGTATLAAFIGAGGLGEMIVVGLSLNDVDMILKGAIPAALLAIAVELGFEALERGLLKNRF